MKKVYMAGPLFTMAERVFNEELRNLLQQKTPAQIQYILPQVRSERFLPDLRAVVEDCFSQVRAADLILACLDGSDADSGTCLEIGLALGSLKPVLGYRTDFRASEHEGLNAMLSHGCTKLVTVLSFSSSMDELAETLSKAVLEYLEG